MTTLRVTLRELQAGVVVPLDERTKIVVVPPAAMVSLQGKTFDPGRTFPRPRATPQLREMFEFAVRLQAKHGVVVGHVGDGENDPEALSKKRAEILLQWLEGDADGWLENYAESTPEPTRWGNREDSLLLGSQVPSSGSGGESLVRQFQQLHSGELAVDGIIGPKTRKKLIESYFAGTRQARRADADEGEGQPFATKLQVHAAAANFDLDALADARKQAREERARAQPSPALESRGTENEVGSVGDTAGDSNRPPAESPAQQASASFARVELVLFSNQPVNPAPAAADGPEYLEWVKQAELFKDLVVGGPTEEPQLFVRLLDKFGTTAHANQKFEITGPANFEGVTDGSGELDFDGVVAGNYELKLTLEFFADPEKHDPADKISDVYSAELVVLPGDATPQVRFIGAVPKCNLARVRGLLFDTNKAFLLPSAISDLKKIRNLYEENNPSELLVVGHTDTTADASVNDPLSLARAKSALAYLRDDVDAWEKFYSQATPQSQRWGEIEDNHMRSTLVTEGINGALEMNRRELITAYMDLDGERLEAGDFDITGTAHGCGENFPVDESGEAVDEAPEDGKEDALDRRVEFFFFETEFGIVPKPRGENSRKGSKQYPAWRELAGAVVDLEVRETNSLLVRPHDATREAMANCRVQAFAGDEALVVSDETVDGFHIVSLPLACPATVRVVWTDQDGVVEYQAELVPFCGESEGAVAQRNRLNNLGYPLALPFERAAKLFQTDYQVDTDRSAALDDGVLPPASRDKLARIFDTCDAAPSDDAVLALDTRDAPPPAPSGSTKNKTPSVGQALQSQVMIVFDDPKTDAYHKAVVKYARDTWQKAASGRTVITVKVDPEVESTAASPPGNKVKTLAEAWQRAATAAGKGGKIIFVGHGFGNDSGGADFFLRMAASEKKPRKEEFNDTVARKSDKLKLANPDLQDIIRHEETGSELFGRAIRFGRLFEIARAALTSNQVKEVEVFGCNIGREPEAVERMATLLQTDVIAYKAFSAAADDGSFVQMNSKDDGEGEQIAGTRTSTGTPPDTKAGRQQTIRKAPKPLKKKE